VEAVVLEVNPTTEKMNLGLKQMTEDPFAAFAANAVVEAKVVRLADHGAYLELAPDIEGYVHVSEIPSEERLKHPSEALTVGQMVTALVIKNDRKKRRIDLSIRKHEKREGAPVVETVPGDPRRRVPGRRDRLGRRRKPRGHRNGFDRRTGFLRTPA
jgi:ribosomal protein S1